MAGRTGVRETLYNFISNPPIPTINKVWTSFPKRIQFQENSQPGQLSRAQVIIFIASENETRLAIGGAHNGWKRVDYDVIIQIYQHSLERNAEDAMVAFDTLVDNLKHGYVLTITLVTQLARSYGKERNQLSTHVMESLQLLKRAQQRRLLR